MYILCPTIATWIPQFIFMANNEIVLLEVK